MTSDSTPNYDNSALAHEDEGYHKSLKPRQIQMIAIGGAIGTGLFMGSGKTIHTAGPSIVVAYLVIGIMLFFVMRAMGEVLLYNLEYKSFQDFAAPFFLVWIRSRNEPFRWWDEPTTEPSAATSHDHGS